MDPEFQVSDIVRISKYKNSIAKGNTDSSEEVFVIKETKCYSMDICYQ